MLQNFLQARQGAVLPLIALGILALVGAAGLAVDVSRKELAQARLSNALDAAGLAAGSSVNTTDINAEVNKYLDANFAKDDLHITVTELNITLNGDATVINLSARGNLTTTFGRIFGVQTMDISAEAEITRSTKGLELVLVMDNTGSMANNNKLVDMKSAATALIDILYGSRETVDNLWVGLVPFSQAVNVGPTHTSWMDMAYLAARNWGPTSWAGCVDARHTGRDVTDDPPSDELFKSYYWPDDGNNDWIRSDGTYRSISSSQGPNKYCPVAVTPMVAEKTTVVNAINAMAARGNTHVGLGAVWGWRMLSPRWRGLWGSQMDANNLPLDYNAPLMNKAAVILTDGMNTMSNNVRTAYWYLGNGRLGTTNGTAAVSELNNRLSQVCTSMKNNGIVVYTIALGSPGASIEALMQSCASDPSYYFDSPSGSDLQQAFRIIGDSLANLRISK